MAFAPRFIRLESCGSSGAFPAKFQRLSRICGEPGVLGNIWSAQDLQKAPPQPEALNTFRPSAHSALGPRAWIKHVHDGKRVLVCEIGTKFAGKSCLCQATISSSSGCMAEPAFGSAHLAGLPYVAEWHL